MYPTCNFLLSSDNSSLPSPSSLGGILPASTRLYPQSRIREHIHKRYLTYHPSNPSLVSCSCRVVTVELPMVRCRRTAGLIPPLPETPSRRPTHACPAMPCHARPLRCDANPTRPAAQLSSARTPMPASRRSQTRPARSTFQVKVVQVMRTQRPVRDHRTVPFVLVPSSQRLTPPYLIQQCNALNHVLPCHAMPFITSHLLTALSLPF